MTMKQRSGGEEWGLEEANLLALKMEEGAMSSQSLEAGKGKETDSP